MVKKKKPKVFLFDCIENGERFVVEAPDKETAQEHAEEYGGECIGKAREQSCVSRCAKGCGADIVTTYRRGVKRAEGHTCTPALASK